MTIRAYYNEVEPYAAQWIRNLIAKGLVTPGDVDTRSIVDVHPSDLQGYDRCHFFAGVAVWDYALGLAGWPAHRPIWTGSCPCQPFSTAGRRGGRDDERHLWPAWHHLIRECRPSTVLGEQVASRDGLDWLDLVHADLDGLGYAFGAADLCAAGVGAPHIRQRLYFVAHAGDERRSGVGLHVQPGQPRSSLPETRWRGEAGALADAAGQRQHRAELGGAPRATARRGAEADDRRAAGLLQPAGRGATRGVGDAGRAGLPARERADLRGAGRWPEGRAAQQSGGPSGRLADAAGRGAAADEQPGRLRGAEQGGAGGFWAAADWLPCRDGKRRPVEPGTFPLAHGAPARVGRLRAYGNAIVAPVAAAFVAACLDVLPTAPPPSPKPRSSPAMPESTVTREAPQDEALAKLAAIPAPCTEERALWLEAAEQHGFELTSGDEYVPEYDPPAYFATADEVLKLMSEARKQGQRDVLVAREAGCDLDVAALDRALDAFFGHLPHPDKPWGGAWHRQMRDAFTAALATREGARG